MILFLIHFELNWKLTIKTRKIRNNKGEKLKWSTEKFHNLK